MGFSDALNRLAKAGAAVVTGGESRPLFSQHTVDLGVTVDVSNIAEVLEVLDPVDDSSPRGDLRWTRRSL
ncbi:MAG: hypothetical protein H7288_10715 [Kineosporiaceae bacterium]|nr:hypothetical protein [Aeromicrobium sp.]